MSAWKHRASSFGSKRTRVLLTGLSAVVVAILPAAPSAIAAATPTSTLAPAPLPTNSPTPTPLAAVGPGGRIFGLDISRYQHTTSAPINFATMAAHGVSFLYINGGNTLPDADALAATYYQSDRAAAQAAGIYTGFYYYVHLPNTTKLATILSSADDQANKVINRINADGGLNSLDLPVALDIETTCTKAAIFGICVKNMSSKNIFAWVTEWVSDIHAATGRNPVIYSFLSLLHGSLGSANSLVINPLWVATAGVSAAQPGSQPGQLKGGCSTNVWTSPGCALQWTIWQYSSVGNGRTYGIPTGNVDQDIFAGSAQDFLNFAATGLEAPMTPPVITEVSASASPVG